METTLPKLPYTPQQVASMYGIPVHRVYSEIKAGRLAARHKRGEDKKWYITETDLVDWIERRMWDESED